MSGTSNNDDNDSAGPPLKRKRCPEKWKQKQRKQKRAGGKATTGSVVPAKQVGPPCACNYKCFDVLGMDHIQTFLILFMASPHTTNKPSTWPIVCHQGRWRDHVWKVGHLECCVHLSIYVIKKDEKEIEVCSTAFLNIHAVSVKRVRNAVHKAMSTGTGIVTPDQRGWHVPAGKLDDAKIALVKEHIRSFKTVSSHYPGAHPPSRRYLPPGLYRKLVYQLYKEWVEKENKWKENIVKKWKYLSVLDSFNMEFELSQGTHKFNTKLVSVHIIYFFKVIS